MEGEFYPTTIMFDEDTIAPANAPEPSDSDELGGALDSVITYVRTTVYDCHGIFRLLNTIAALGKCSSHIGHWRGG